MDLAEKEKSELKILEAFLPRSASKVEIETVVKRLADEMMKSGTLDQKSIGKLTGMTMKELGCVVPRKAKGIVCRYRGDEDVRERRTADDQRP
jgi:uncharacterized protein YqeY